MKRLLLIALFGILLLSVPARAAWTAQTATCLTQSEAASTTTLTRTVATANIEAGNVAVVTCAADNVSGSGNTNDHGDVTDSASNSWTKAYEFTEGTGGSGGGATVSVHYSKLATQLSSGSGTITCNFNTAVTDKAMHLVQEFTIGAGNVVSVAGTPQGAESDGGDAPSQTISGLTSQEYLFVRGIGAESNAVLSMTKTASYNNPDDPTDSCNGTTGGGEASDMAACSEWRILSGTGDTSDPTLVDTSNDNASVYVALLEAAPPTRSRAVVVGSMRAGAHPGVLVAAAVLPPGAIESHAMTFLGGMIVAWALGRAWRALRRR